MIITESKIVTRPNTSKPFFNEIAPMPAPMAAVSDAIRPFVENGSVSAMVSTLSADGLVQTNTRTFSSLEIYSQVDTLFSIALEHALGQYYDGEEFVLTSGNQYTQSGINQPFTCTTTYTYPTNIVELYPLFNSFVSIIEYSDKLTAFSNTGTQLIATHTYDDSEDFTENHWYDYTYIGALFAGQVTRTIAYATV